MEEYKFAFNELYRKIRDNQEAQRIFDRSVEFASEDGLLCFQDNVLEEDAVAVFKLVNIPISDPDNDDDDDCYDIYNTLIAEYEWLVRDALAGNVDFSRRTTKEELRRHCVQIVSAIDHLQDDVLHEELKKLRLLINAF